VLAFGAVAASASSAYQLSHCLRPTMEVMRPSAPGRVWKASS